MSQFQLPAPPRQLPTADLLGTLRRDLIKEGFTPDEAFGVIQNLLANRAPIIVKTGGNS